MGLGSCGGCGWCGKLECGSSSTCLRRASSSSFDSGSEGLGCIPGRCAFFGDFIPVFALGVYYSSPKSFLAMGLLRIWGSHGVFFFDDGDRRWIGVHRWRPRAISGSSGFLDFTANFSFSKDLCARWVGQLSMYPIRVYLYLSMYLYVFLILRNTGMLKKKKLCLPSLLLRLQPTPPPASSTARRPPCSSASSRRRLLPARPPGDQEPA